MESHMGKQALEAIKKALRVEVYAPGFGYLKFSKADACEAYRRAIIGNNHTAHVLLDRGVAILVG